MNKDTKFKPIKRKCGLKKLAELYCSGYSKGTDLFLYDYFFNKKYLKLNNKGEFIWQI